MAEVMVIPPFCFCHPYSLTSFDFGGRDITPNVRGENPTRLGLKVTCTEFVAVCCEAEKSVLTI